MSIEMDEKIMAMKMMVRMFYSVQKERVGMGQRITDFKKYYPNAMEEAEALDRIYTTSGDIEKATLREIRPLVRQFDIYEQWLKHVHGIGEILAAGLISCIRTPARFSNVSKLWAYAGLHVVYTCALCGKIFDGVRSPDGELVEDAKMQAINHLINKHGLKREEVEPDYHLVGVSPKRSKGIKFSWSPLLRTIAWKCGESFVRSGKYYRKVYERFKIAEEKKNLPRKIPLNEAIGKVPVDEKIREMCKKKDRTGRTVYVIDKNHVAKLKKEGISAIDVILTPKAMHERAKRKTVKLFLAHLWEVWRELEGVPVSEPYPKAILGHSDIVRAPRPGIGGI